MPLVELPNTTVQLAIQIKMQSNSLLLPLYLFPL
jgi:hypothetical protein